jgi:hypothetical protein
MLKVSENDEEERGTQFSSSHAVSINITIQSAL